MKEVNDEAAKKAFIKYLEEHPDERLFQAIRNFSGWPFIYASASLLQESDNVRDTFYWQGELKKDEGK